MPIQKTTYTSQEFWEFVNLPENAERFFERIDGEIIEHMPSTPRSSEIAMRIAYFVTHYLTQNSIARITGEQGGYDVTEEDTFAPDVAVILKSRQPVFPEEGFNPIPPDFVVEVISPSDLKDPKRRIQRKQEKYAEAKIPLVWYVFYDPQRVEVHAYGKLVRVAGIEDTLDGGSVLPGFQLRVRDIFPD